MRRATAVKFLLPHGIAAVCFLLSFAWWWGIAGNNRSLPDLYLALAGYAALAVALLVSLLFVFEVILKPDKRYLWPWLFPHAAASALTSSFGLLWLFGHLV